MKELKYQADDDYLCAANSYSGFYSEFERVFRADKFKRVYILKGGPGTGKSSIMRHLSDVLAKTCERVDAIYCSSPSTCPLSVEVTIEGMRARVVSVIPCRTPIGVSPSA